MPVPAAIAIRLSNRERVKIPSPVRDRPLEYLRARMHCPCDAGLLAAWWCPCALQPTEGLIEQAWACVAASCVVIGMP